MLEVTRKKLRAEIEQKRLADKPPPGVNPVLAKLLKTQAVKSKSYAPKHPEIYSVAVDKKKTLSAGSNSNLEVCCSESTGPSFNW